MNDKNQLYLGTAGQGVSFLHKLKAANENYLIIGETGEGKEWKTVEGWAREFCLTLPSDYESDRKLRTVSSASPILDQLIKD